MDFSGTSSNEPLHVNPSLQYLLISPCRDEAKYLRRTLDSVGGSRCRQRFGLWLTTDRPTRPQPSWRITPAACPTCVWWAFSAGLETVRLEDFDYLCKLDMDLDLPVRYFELLMERMESYPRVSTTSGKPSFVHPQRGTLVPEVRGDEMPVGMTKFYRVACFKEIGGFVRQTPDRDRGTPRGAAPPTPPYIRRFEKFR